MDNNKRRYAAIGPIRGNCGHAHRTVRAAHDCAMRDHRALRASGSLSDRSVAAVTGCSPDWYDPMPLTDGECNELQRVWGATC